MELPDFGEADPQWRAQTRLWLVSGAAAKGTQSGRDCAWRQWGVFSKGSGKPIRLAETNEGEDLVLDWISHMAFVRRLKFGTIKSKVGQLNANHVLRGWGAPLDTFKRVKMALDHLRRLSGPPKRKHPAGPPVLRRCMQLAARWSARDRLTLRLLLTIGFSFMLRSSEFLFRGGAGWDLKRWWVPRYGFL